MTSLVQKLESIIDMNDTFPLSDDVVQKRQNLAAYNLILVVSDLSAFACVCSDELAL